LLGSGVVQLVASTDMKVKFQARAMGVTLVTA
jgi:hypothetical protein